jgi:cytochrome c oxidase assembly protein subunit 11
MPSTRRSHNRTALICAVVVVGMTGAAFAAVPLYKAFCQATGWAGTARRATVAPRHALAETVIVNFDTNVSNVPVTFQALQRSQTVNVGAANIAFFKVANTSDRQITVRAAYNVSPDQAGAHVRKLQCFCFSAQTLKPHQSAEFPVVYFIDPAFATDPEMKGFQDITLSYTFVSDEAEAPKAAPAKVAATKPAPALGAAGSAGL